MAISICACSDATNQKNAPVSSPAVIPAWSQEVRYEKLMQIKEVRDLVSRHAAMAKKGQSAEEFLAECDKLIPQVISTEKVGMTFNQMWASLGVKTGQERSEDLPNPPGMVITSALCSLARNGQSLRQVRQFEDGCLLEAELPSDFRSFAGVIYVSVRKNGTATHIDGAILIKGQMLDWGKSKNCLEVLFADLMATPV